MSALHAVLGGLALAVNLLAGLYGAWRWWQVEPSRVFWIALRAGQALVVLVVAQGAVLLLLDYELPTLHLVYGLVPVAVSFLAEQLRLAAADTVLSARGLADAQAVGRLPDAEQRSIVLAVVRREMGVMAASALVVAALSLRASGLL
jgi:uncharacterized membrane protein